MCALMPLLIFVMLMITNSIVKFLNCSELLRCLMFI